MESAEKKKNITLLIIMAIAIAGTLFFVLNKKSSVEITDNFDDIFDSGVEIPERIEVDVFSSKTFKALEDYSDKDLKLEPRGKENPFKPFEIIKTPDSTLELELAP